jgi:uncharacterized damage-inducible protein DinB
MPHLLFHTLFAHLRWADLRVLQALREADSPPADALEIYAHILGAEHTWLARLRGNASELPVWPRLSFEECARYAETAASGFDRFLTALGPDDLDRRVAYVNSAGDAFESRVEDILMHVALHGSYHRGQIALLLRSAGEKPIPTDYIAFTRGAPAATRR